MNRDYIVLVDENGQPYIAHGLFGNVKRVASNASSRAHKYIAKWGEGAKARYFYTKAELEAAMKQGKQKVSDAANTVRKKGRDALGITAKENRDKAYADMVRSSRDAGRAQIRGAAAIANAHKAYTDAQKATDDAQKVYKNATNRFLGAVGDTAGAHADNALSKFALQREAADKEEADKNARRWITTKIDYDEAARANEDYERALDDRKRAASEKRMADKEYTKLMKDTDRSYRNYLTKMQEKEDARREEGRAKIAAQRDNDRLQDLATMAKERYESFDRAYSDTPLAKVKEAAEKVKGAASSAKDKASDAIDKAKVVASNAREKASEAADKVKGVASTAKDKASNAADKVKGAASGAADVAKDASSKVKSAYDRMRDEFAKKREEKNNKVDQNNSGSKPNETKSIETKPKIDPKIDISKLADNEYVYALGSNTGHAGEVKKVMDAESAYNIAMRNYNRIAASKNASGQDKNAAKREMDKMKKEYEALLNDLVDTLNKE